MVQQKIKNEVTETPKPKNWQLKLREKLPKNPTQLLIGIGMGMILTIGGGVLFNGEKKSEIQLPTTEIQNNSSVKTVTTTSVETTETERTIQGTGTVAAFELIPVSSQATGLQITTILAEEGDMVEAGQTLALLNNEVLQAQIAKEEANVRRARASLAELEAGNRPEEIARAEAAVKSAQAGIIKAESDLDLAEKRVERNRDLEAAGAIARDYLDEILNAADSKKSDLEQAKARLQEAEEQLQELQRGPRIERILQAKAELAEAEAQLAVLKTQLAQTEIVAPVEGKIAERNARVGDLSNNNSQLFTIIQGGRLELRLEIPETLIEEIEPGQKVKFNTYGETKLGQVRSIKPLISEDSRQAIVEVDLPEDTRLKPGMFLSAEIITETSTTLTIPNQAVLPETQGTAKVYVVEEGRAQLREIQLGEILPENRVEVLAGLNPGETVVLKGAVYLNPGDRVREN